MNPKSFTLFSVLVALSASGVVRPVSAEPEAAAPSAAEGRASERTDESAAKPGFDPKLLSRLVELEATRRAARKEALKDPKSWEENRAQRANARRAELAALWGNIVGSIDGQARLRMHAERMARLNRMLDLAESKPDPALVSRIQADIKRELTRHAQAMQELQAAAGLR